MKKIVVLLLTVCFSSPLFAGDDRPIDKERLPVPAKDFISQYFTDTEISLATMDKELFDTTYEVFFTNGCKVEFDRNGKWKDIDCKYSRIPDGAIPEEISRFIASNHSGRYAKEIDRDKRDYEVKLDNGLELKFDLRFRLIGYDD